MKVHSDPYFDKGLGELKNLLNVETAAEFREKEAQIVFARQLTIADAGIPSTGDMTELSAIHRHLFGDIYSWAGEPRTVDIRKDADSAEFFLPASRIQLGADFVFRELRDKNFLENLPRAKFVRCLGYFYDQLNYIHPFREGNGRAQRVFWSRIAERAGYELDWTRVTGDENDVASRLAAEKLDLTLLIRMLENVVG